MIERGLMGLILALWAWSYRTVWTAGFVYEDLTAHGAYTTRPLTAWTWTLTPTPMTAHALNLALALVVAGLVWVVARALGFSRWGALVASELWLLHPLSVEAVAYASSRAELLATIGILIAVLGATRPATVTGAIGLMAGVVLALASKESGVVVLLLMPLTIAWTRRQWDLETALPVAVCAVVMVIGLDVHGGFRAVMNYGGTDSVSTLAVTWWDWLLIQAAATQHWLTAAVWLSGLTPDPDLDRVPLLWRMASVGLLGTLGVTAAWLRHRRPLVAFGLAWCLVALVPRFIVQTPQGYLNAHQFTVPFLGVLFAAVGVTERMK